MTQDVDRVNDEVTDLAAAAFASGRRILHIQAIGQGNINDTYLVTLDPSPDSRYILQRLNTQVFREPQKVMGNLRLLTEHVQRRLESAALEPGRRWEAPRLFTTNGDADHYLAPDGSFWRALSYIDEADSWETVSDARQAWEVGYALGLFHSLVNDLPAASLADTLPGFHVTPNYLTHYDAVLAAQPPPASPEVRYAMQFINERRHLAPVLEDARAQGRLPVRPMHGDPKVNNFMMDRATGQAVGLVDLDTVKPGLIHYDLGDCLRSAANPWGEETEAWEGVRFDVDLGRALLQGYLSQAQAFLTAGDYEYLYDSLRLLAFELGLRFFTDYLEGDVYFKARHREHNLVRALVQLALARSMEAQESLLRAIIQELPCRS